jgi:hypothetical protein
VARAAGNTTYRLVRQVHADGTEEVLVTGRRATQPGVADLAPPELTAPELTAPELTADAPAPAAS